jgi:hypothetical protein
MSGMKGKLSAGRPSSRAKQQTLGSLADRSEFARVNFDLDRDLHKKLKIYATQRGKTVKEVLTEFVVSLPNE